MGHLCRTRHRQVKAAGPDPSKRAAIANKLNVWPHTSPLRHLSPRAPRDACVAGDPPLPGRAPPRARQRVIRKDISLDGSCAVALTELSKDISNNNGDEHVWNATLERRRGEMGGGPPRAR